MKDGMGFRSSSVPYNMGSPFREQQGHSLAEPAVQKLLSVMPAQYALSTLPSDRAQHAQLLQNLHIEQQREGRESQNVHLSWAPYDSRSFSLWLVFNDRRGSLGVITSVLAEFGIDISKVAAFSTPDGVAVDSFAVSRMDEELAAKMRVRLSAAFCGPWTAAHNVTDVAITDWSGLSLGRAAADPDTMMEEPPPLPITPASMPPLPGACSTSAVGGAGGACSSSSVGAGGAATSASPRGGAAAYGGAMADLTREELQTLEGLQGQFSNLRVRRLIDEGASSKVWEAEWAGARVVIKVLREDEALRSFLGEVNIWRQLRHPCVCSLLGVCLFEEMPAMVLEFLQGGSLHDLLHNPEEPPLVPPRPPSRDSDVPPRPSSRDGIKNAGSGPLDAPLLARIVKEIASGVAYLHYNGVMHRDIKTANVLLDESGHAKVTDFGISTRFGRSEYTAETGTYRQMAPEVILHKPYNYKCDVYSFGMLLWETLHRKIPFTDFAPLQAAFAVAMENARPPIHLREELKEYAPLITACWDTNPAARPAMDAVVLATAECLTRIDAAAAAQHKERMQAASAAAAQQAMAEEESPQEAGGGGSSMLGRGVIGLTGALASKLSLSGLGPPRPPSRG